MNVVARCPNLCFSSESSSQRRHLLTRVREVKHVIGVAGKYPLMDCGTVQSSHLRTNYLTAFCFCRQYTRQLSCLCGWLALFQPTTMHKRQLASIRRVIPSREYKLAKLYRTNTTILAQRKPPVPLRATRKIRRGRRSEETRLWVDRKAGMALERLR